MPADGRAPASPDHPPRVLSIAGTDPTGGAGTAADLKSITAAGGYGMSVVTCLVAQNTTGVRALHLPPVDFLGEQLRAVGEDVTIDAVKTGMLATAEIIVAVEDWLSETAPPVLVIDPVMVATSGDRLLEAEAEEAMRSLCRAPALVTPNIPELAVLTDQQPATGEEGAVEQARRLAGRTGARVLVKTGHLGGPRVVNVLVGPDGVLARADAPRVRTRSTHGTGCSLSAALATRLGAGQDPQGALEWVTDWLHEAVVHGSVLQVGRGHGPIDHSHRSRRLQQDRERDGGLRPDGVADES